MKPTRNPTRWMGLGLGSGLAACMLLSPLAASAQTAHPVPGPSVPVPASVVALSDIPSNPPNMTSTQLQGVGCIALGLLTAAGTLYYSTSVTLAAVAADWGLPLLAIPVAAGGYAVGCNVGSTTAPGAYWVYAWLNRS